MDFLHFYLKKLKKKVNEAQYMFIEQGNNKMS